MSLVSCDKSVNYGGNKILKYYPNGQLESEREIANGKNNGRATEYYENGTTRMISYFKNDSLDGEVLRFYPNGRLELKANFDKGVAQGMAYYFYPSGVIKAFRYWNNGKMKGYVSDYWDTIGEVKAALYYDEQGKLVYKKNFDERGQFIGQE